MESLPNLSTAAIQISQSVNTEGNSCSGEGSIFISRPVLKNLRKLLEAGVGIEPLANRRHWPGMAALGVMRLNVMSLRKRSILSNVCFAAGGLFVCLVSGGFLSLSFPGGGFLPLLVLNGLLGLAAYVRTRGPSFRSIMHSTPGDWLLGIPLACCFLAGYVYHLVSLQIVSLVIAVAGQMRREFAAIRDYNASHPA